MRFWLVVLGFLLLLAALLGPFGGRQRPLYTGWPRELQSATESIDRRLLAAVGIGCLVGAMFV